MHQKINEFEQGTKRVEYIERFKNTLIYYDIACIYELSNGNLISGNSYGLKIYDKKNDEYILISTINTEIDVEKIIEIKPHILILFEKKSEVTGKHAWHYIHSIFIYDIQNKKEININGYPHVNKYKPKLNILIKNNYLLDRYDDYLDIYNIDQNMTKIGTELMKREELIEDFTVNSLKIEMDIDLLCDYIDNFFIVKNNFYNEIKIYKFENEKVDYYCDFPIKDIFVNEIIKLKNNMLVMYNHAQVYFINYLNNKV